MDVELQSVTWERYLNAAKKLAKELCDAWYPAPPLIWGIPRGGTIATAIMSYWGCTLVDNPYVQNVIIIDDIADTGKTLERYVGYRDEIVFATLFVRQKCSTYPGFWSEVIKTDEYVLFPYENSADVIKQITKTQSYRTSNGGD